MKRTLHATILVLLATSAVVAAATSADSRANNHFPNEWEQVFRSPVNDSNNAVIYPTEIFNNYKNK